MQSQAFLQLKKTLYCSFLLPFHIPFSFMRLHYSFSPLDKFCGTSLSVFSHVPHQYYEAFLNMIFQGINLMFEVDYSLLSFINLSFKNLASVFCCPSVLYNVVVRTFTCLSCFWFCFIWRSNHLRHISHLTKSMLLFTRPCVYRKGLFVYIY